MFLFLVFLLRSDAPERAVERLTTFGLTDPLVIRARSAAQVLSADVPMFAGLRSLAPGADEDRLMLVSLWKGSADDAQKLVSRVQLEMDADDPPMGRIVALPLIS
jgi:hypothetical protein